MFRVQRRFFERRKAHFDVFPFDSFDGVIKDTLGRPYTARCTSIR
jgi:hypothetical protein